MLYLSRSLALATLACAIALPVAAQTAAPKKPAPKQPVVRKKAEPPKPPPPPVLSPASDEQLAAAKLAHLGVYECEFNQSVQIIPYPQTSGYIEVAWNKNIYVMKPVLSSTGALRLEDVSGRTLMIQIANKSMLMDTKIGQRLVDECIHPVQRAAIEAAKANPAPAESSLGIDPAKAAAAAVAAAAASAAASAPASTPGSAPASAPAQAAPASAPTSAPALAPASAPAFAPASAPASAPAAAASAPG